MRNSRLSLCTRFRSTALFLLASAATLAVTPIALAAGVKPADANPAQKKEATDHFSAGKQAFESNDYETAIVELRKSVDVVDSPNTRLELARALRDSGKPTEARAEYKAASELASGLVAKEPRYAKTGEVADNERRDLEGKLGFVSVTVAHAPPTATLTVAGRSIPTAEWTSPVVVAPGAVDIALVDGAGADLAHVTVSVGPGQTIPVPMEGAPIAVQPAAPGLAMADDANPSGANPAPAAATAPVPPNNSIVRPLAYVSAGVGVAGLATFAVFGLLSNSTYSDLKTACAHGCPFGKQGEVDSGMMEQTVANVGLGVGIAGVVAGATMFLLSKPASAQQPTTGLVVAPGYVGMRGSL